DARFAGESRTENLTEGSRVRHLSTARLQIPAWLGDWRLNRWLNEFPVQFRSPGPQVAPAAGEIQLLAGADADAQVVTQCTAFGNHFSKRVEDHRASVADLAVVHADGVAEDRVDAVLPR